MTGSAWQILYYTFTHIWIVFQNICMMLGFASELPGKRFNRRFEQFAELTIAQFTGL